MEIEANLTHRPEPDELVEAHWSFTDKMKPALHRDQRGSDMREFSSPRHDQRQTNSCAAQSVIKVNEILRIKKWGKKAHVDLSRLAAYFLGRELMSPPETDQDEGVFISAVAEAVRRFGVCAEELWPFDEKLVLKSPPWRVMQSAYKNQIAGWTRIKTTGAERVEEVIMSLHNGIPVAYGTMVGKNWMQYGSNSEPLGIPDKAEGAHATVLLGWDPQKGVLIGENSWGCYDDQTEVLTSEGWKKFADLQGSEVFATLNPKSHLLEYQPTSKLHVYDYDGHLWNFNSDGVDLAVTPNHRMYVTNHHKRHLTDWPIVRADSITGNRRVCFKKDAVNDTPDIEYFNVAGVEVQADTWLEFMGYFLSEGSTTFSAHIRTRERYKSRKVKGGVVRCGTTGQFILNDNPEYGVRTGFKVEHYVEKYHVTSLTQSQGVDADTIAKCLAKVPFSFSERSVEASGNRKARRDWSCQSKPLYLELSKYGKAHEKYIPRELLKLSTRQSKILLESLILGDGSSEGSWKYYTSSPRLADDVQELALRSGMAADISRVDRTDQPGYNYIEYCVGIKRTKVRPESRHIPVQSPYVGKVYCVTVPNGLVYVRRNGKAVWCGNSDWGQDGFYEIRPEVIASSGTSDLTCITEDLTKVVAL